MMLSVTPRLLEPEGLRLIDELTGGIGRMKGFAAFTVSPTPTVVAGTAGAESVPFAPGLEARARAKRCSALADNPQLASLLVPATAARRESRSKSTIEGDPHPGTKSFVRFAG
jgi:hypothetical protein